MDTPSPSFSKSSSRRSFNAENHDILVCDICLEPYDDHYREAKFLQCHHSFCEHCLRQVIQSRDSLLECPTCRKSTPLGPHGIDGLQTNFYINYMRDTFTKLGVPKVKGCQRHSSQPLSFFCNKCGVTICRDCTVLDHNEADEHEIQDVATADSEQRHVLANQITGAKLQLCEIRALIQYLKTESANLCTAKDAVLENIDDTFQGLADLLVARKEQLKNSLWERYDIQEGNIDETIQSLSNSCKDLSSTVEQAERVAKKGPLGEVVCTKTMLMGSVEEAEKFMSLINVGKNYLQFDQERGADMIRDAISNVGQVISEQALPSKIDVISQSVQAGLPSKITLRASTFPEESLHHYPIGVKVYDQLSTECIFSKVHTVEGQDYQVTFMPQVYGLHRVVPTFLGQPIVGMEMDVMVQTNSPVQVIGGLGSGHGRFKCPRAIALDNDDNLFVADTGNKLIQKFSPDGKFVKQFRIDNGKEDCSTCDLALDRMRSVIVCTETAIGQGMNPTMGSTVATYSLEGVLQQAFVNKVMKCALCVATNSHGHILVSDYLVHTLFMYDSQGSFLRRIGNAGTFNHPAFIAVGKDDIIIVSDTNNDCVQVFDKVGNFQFQFGSSGSGKGQLKQPFGVGTDGEHIVVVDSGNHRIQIFDNKGRFYSIIDSADSRLDQPRGVAVTKDGHLYIADRDNHCIKKYRYK